MHFQNYIHQAASKKIAEIIGVEKHHDLNGKIQLEKKTDMKKRGLCSPDLGDGLALTFAEPVVLPSKYAEYDKNYGKLKTEYDILDRAG